MDYKGRNERVSLRLKDGIKIDGRVRAWAGYRDTDINLHTRRCVGGRAGMGGGRPSAQSASTTFHPRIRL